MKYINLAHATSAQNKNFCNFAVNNSIGSTLTYAVNNRCTNLDVGERIGQIPTRQGPLSTVAVVSEWSITDFIMVDLASSDKYSNLRWTN